MNSSSNSSTSIDTVAQLKQAGNAAFSKGEISNAIELYTRAIELAKATEPGAVDPALYSNRAACQLKVADWPAAVRDCDAGMSLIALLLDSSPDSVNVGVQSKLYFRKATALEAEGYPGLAIRVCEDGVSALATAGKQHQQVLVDFKTRLAAATAATTTADATTPTLEAKVELFETEDAFPSDLLLPSELPKFTDSTSSESNGSTTSSANANAKDILPAAPVIPFVPPGLPLTVQSIMQLLRTPATARAAMHEWVFAEVTPASLPLVLGRAGVEPELVDLVLDVLLAAASAAAASSSQLDDETRLTRSMAYLDALATCPRFAIARMFCSDAKLRAFMVTLSPEQLQRYSSTLAKWK
ncbi:hypothetical protein D0Z00_000389 [Geotrichum galactomycetum]|uniref:Uncharacterized protein n=1 Tax=Geotrichum galactomycetum TaxID=27317 RepID=A0ACB6VA63_9ASCO|nr:hypothetical protein D0Z00_000389 [Geotrichum candidum]